MASGLEFLLQTVSEQSENNAKRCALDALNEFTGMLFESGVITADQQAALYYRLACRMETLSAEIQAQNEAAAQRLASRPWWKRLGGSF